jgi:chromate reductase, NAD(P)H dehydrogenase (quinone)
MTKVLAVSGSLRKRSHNSGLIRAVAEHAPADVVVEIYDALESLPPYNEDRDTDPVPPAVADLRARIAAADAILISTPEYNGTIPGQLKELIDWGSRPFKASALMGKPVAVVGVSVADYGALWAQDHLKKSLGIAGARVVEIDLPVGGSGSKFDADGNLTDQETIDRVVEVITALVDHHRSLIAA